MILDKIRSNIGKGKTDEKEDNESRMKKMKKKKRIHKK
jgi:hypothetical protein